jgi:hypothetical protein
VIEQSIELAQQLQGTRRRCNRLLAPIASNAGCDFDQLEPLEPVNQFAAAARTPKAHLLIEMDQLGNRDRLVLRNQ